MTDTCNNFEQSLILLLTKLHKKDWATPIKGLEEKFRQIPDTENSFCIEMINLLHQLCEAREVDSDIPLAQLAAIRLASLDCWTYRFFRDATDGRHYLDPLTASSSDFSHGIAITQSSTAYPATDIIKRWAREHLR
ncbi:hypothetical protein [Cellvibrio sp. UBA7671]|uniref:hypothetical protein n=1 Tax=Cellvibrio sp. UBA7671 TaxID=1946312 RepID=UPI002F360A3F